jgi:hypothetical protein
MKFGIIVIMLTVWLAIGFASPTGAGCLRAGLYGPQVTPWGPMGSPGRSSFHCQPAALPVAYEPPPMAYAPLPSQPPPPPPAIDMAPPPLGWLYSPYTVCADPNCSALFVAVGADGLNVRIAPNGPVILSLANGTPVIPLQRQGDWVLVAPGCVLVPTWTWSVTADVPLSVCL